MALLDLRSTKSKLALGGVVALIVAFLLWPRFRGTSNKYEDDYLEELS